GEEIWCQLFSEPAAGSDVAGVKTRAVKDGDEWVINGQKVWTTGAHFSDYGILLTRTDPKAPKHKGLTMFIVNMKQKGVEAKPIHQASGGREFNEVYFTDVRIPDSDRLGEVGEGWKVAIVTLMNERLAVGGSPGPDWKEIMDYARDTGSLSDQAFREKLADWYVAAQGYSLTKFRTQTALSRGETPGPENSIGKIITANQLQDICNSAIEMQDHYGIMNDSDTMPANALFQQSFMWAPGLRIAGGTDEILKNIIAERVLGLPQDVRVDKDVPFESLKQG
ncbi:MAG: acyl-CoA dehydrogenase family protein, partial [Henriciella sp.]